MPLRIVPLLFSLLLLVPAADASLCREVLIRAVESDALTVDLQQNSALNVASFSEFERVRAARAKFEKVPKEHASVHVIGFNKIKLLNEKIWGFVQTELFLEDFDHALLNFLADNPQYGEVFNFDYKRHYIWSDLSAPNFDQLVLRPVLKVIASEAEKLSGSPEAEPGSPWSQWLFDGITHSRTSTLIAGDPLINAHFDHQIGRARTYQDSKPTNFESWRKTAVAHRASLYLEAEKAGLNWTQLIRLSHQTFSRDGDPVALQTLLKSHGATSLYFDLMRFVDDLQVGDFFSPHDTGDWTLAELSQQRMLNPLAAPSYDWIIDRRIMLDLSRNAAAVLAVDVKGLGEEARLLQDQWLATGADAAKLYSVYAPIDTELLKLFSSAYSQIRQKGITAYLYWSGDDALWSFAGPLSPAQENQITSIFAASANQYVSRLSRVVKVGETASLAAAIVDARHSLIDEKKTPTKAK